VDWVNIGDKEGEQPSVDGEEKDQGKGGNGVLDLSTQNLNSADITLVAHELKMNNSVVTSVDISNNPIHEGGQKGCGLCKQPIESSKQGQWEVNTTGIVNWADALTQL
jgi:hypothetical protein